MLRCMIPSIERSDDLLIALLLMVIIQLLLHRRGIVLSRSRPMVLSLRAYQSVSLCSRGAHPSLARMEIRLLVTSVEAR
jgi:hypothetical protein